MKFNALLTATLALGLTMTTNLVAQESDTSVSTKAATDAENAAKAAEANSALSEKAQAEAQATADAAQLPEEVLKVIGKPEPGKALVVFFRPSRFTGAAISFKVREGEVELGKLKNGTYILTQVDPGKHTYTVHSEAKDITNIEAEEGETYFLSGGISMGLMVGRPNLTPSDAAKFQAEMKKLKVAR